MWQVVDSNMLGQGKLSIYFSGPHSTGKTTLQEALLKNDEFSKLNFKAQKEVARTTVQEVSDSQDMLTDPVKFLDLAYKMLYAQLEKEETECSDGNVTRFLWDRSIVDPLIYTKLFCKEGAVDDMLKIPAVQTALSRLRKTEETHTFVLKPRREFIEVDGVRPASDLEELMKIYHVFVELLSKHSVPHTVIEEANLTERVHIVLKTIQQKWPFLANSNRSS